MEEVFAREEQLLLEEYFTACKEEPWSEVRQVLNRMPFYLGARCDRQTMMNALHFVCLGNNLEVAHAMFRIRKDVFIQYLYSKSNRDETPIDLACRLGHGQMVELLFNVAKDEGAQPDCEEGSVLHIACVHGHVDIVERLLRIDNSLVDKMAGILETPLHKAVQNSRVEVVRALLNYGADVNRRTIANCTPLHLAVFSRQWGIMKLLLEHSNTDLEAADFKGRTALRVASAMPSRKAVELLLAYRANASTRDARSTTPLHSAALCGDSRIFKCLLEAGAEVNVVNVSHETPLSVASCGGHADMVRALLDAGAEMYVEGRCQAVSCARGFEQWHILRMLTATLIDRYTARGLGQMLVSQGMAWMVKRFSRH